MINVTKQQIAASLLALLVGTAILIQPLAVLGITLAVAISIVMLLAAPYAVAGLHFGGASETLRYLLGDSLPHGLAALVTVAVLLCILRKGRINRGVTSLLVLSQVGFVILMFASIQWAADPQQGLSKLGGFIANNMLAFIVPLLIVTSTQEAERVIVAFGVGAATLTASLWYVTATGSIAEVQRLQGLNIGSIGSGRIAGLGALVAIYWIWQAGHKHRAALPVLAGVLLFFLYGLIASQTRGAVVAFVIGLLVFGGCNWIYLHRPGMAWVTIGGASVSAVVAFATLPAEFVGRYYNPLSTAARRIMLLNASWQMFLDAPLIGAGAGATEYLLGIWPHNLSLETGAELGLAGLVLLSILLVGTFLAALRTLKAARPDYQEGILMTTLLACFTFAIVEAQLSANIVGNAVIWFFAGMILAVSTVEKERHREG